MEREFASKREPLVREAALMGDAALVCEAALMGDAVGERGAGMGVAESVWSE